eukprot:Nk52_evm1s1693 gene=Nk52_evmTU1s1693
MARLFYEEIISRGGVYRYAKRAWISLVCCFLAKHHIGEEKSGMGILQVLNRFGNVTNQRDKKTIRKLHEQIKKDLNIQAVKNEEQYVSHASAVLDSAISAIAFAPPSTSTSSSSGNHSLRQGQPPQQQQTLLRLSRQCRVQTRRVLSYVRDFLEIWEQYSCHGVALRSVFTKIFGWAVAVCVYDLGMKKKKGKKKRSEGEEEEEEEDRISGVLLKSVEEVEEFWGKQTRTRAVREVLKCVMECYAAISPDDLVTVSPRYCSMHPEIYFRDVVEGKRAVCAYLSGERRRKEKANEKKGTGGEREGDKQKEEEACGPCYCGGGVYGREGEEGDEDEPLCEEEIESYIIPDPATTNPVLATMKRIVMSE